LLTLLDQLQIRRPDGVAGSGCPVLPGGRWTRPVRVARARTADDSWRVGLTTVEEPGCYGSVRPWASRASWLLRVGVAIATDPTLLRSPSMRDSVSPVTFMKVLTVVVGHADHATGRSIKVTNKTVAVAAGCAEKTVTRVMRIAERRLDVIRTIAHARPLTMDERHTVRGRRQAPGVRCTQRGLPTVRAAHVPDWMATMTSGITSPVTGQDSVFHAPVIHHHSPSPAALFSCSPVPDPVDCVTQPRRAAAFAAGHVEKLIPCAHDENSLRSMGTGCAGLTTDEVGGVDSGGAPDRCGGPAPDSGAAGAGSRAPNATARRTKGLKKRKTLMGEGLARQIAARVPWGYLVSPRRCAPVLADFERAGWTGADWIRAADLVLAAKGSTGWAAPAQLTNAGGYLAWLTGHMYPDSADPITRPVPVACGRSECDHGWIDLPDGRVALCRVCEPAVRSAQAADPDHAGPDAEPLF
jgi:hypothetical protein